MFLTPEQIAELTGRIRASQQLAWLRDHGWRHETNAAGRPIVMVAEAERHLLGGAAPVKSKPAPEPRFDLMGSR